MFDLKFLEFAATNPKLNEKCQIQLLDLLAKLFLQPGAYSDVIQRMILQMFEHNLRNQIVNDFAVKFVKVALSMFFASEKKKKLNIKLTKPTIGVEYDQEALQALKRY